MKGFSETHRVIMNEIARLRNGIAVKSALIARIPQSLFQLLAYGLQDLYAGKLFAISSHNGPRGIGSVRQSDHIIDRRLILSPLLSVAPVFVGYFVPFVWDF